jgi:hypothetical protein
MSSLSVVVKDLPEAILLEPHDRRARTPSRSYPSVTVHARSQRMNRAGHPLSQAREGTKRNRRNKAIREQHPAVGGRFDRASKIPNEAKFSRQTLNNLFLGSRIDRDFAGTNPFERCVVLDSQYGRSPVRHSVRVIKSDPMRRPPSLAGSERGEMKEKSQKQTHSRPHLRVGG